MQGDGLPISQQLTAGVLPSFARVGDGISKARSEGRAAPLRQSVPARRLDRRPELLIPGRLRREVAGSIIHADAARRREQTHGVGADRGEVRRASSDVLRLWRDGDVIRRVEQVERSKISKIWHGHSKY